MTPTKLHSKFVYYKSRAEKRPEQIGNAKLPSYFLVKYLLSKELAEVLLKENKYNDADRALLTEIKEGGKMKKSLYGYSDDELSLIVFNTEYLYNQRHKRGFIRNLLQDYRATKKQIAVLKQDLLSDKVEMQKNEVNNVTA